MTQTPSSDPTPDKAAEAPQENQPVQPQPGVETEVGTDQQPDTEPDQIDH